MTVMDGLFGSSLGRAINDVKDGLEKGIDCPCCDQYCKVYKRRLNSNMAAFLCRLVAECCKNGGEPVHHAEIRKETYGRDYPYLKLWRLMTDELVNDDQKRCSGYWLPTNLGVKFVQGESFVPKWLMVYNNQVREKSEETTSIVGALGKRFNYSVLMERL